MAAKRGSRNMDVYEATRVVLARIQSMDADNAAKIMGYILIQEQGDKEMIRLAFGPDALLHSVILKARGDLGLAGPPLPSSAPSLFSLRARQNTSRFSSLAGAYSPTSFSPSPTFSRSGRGPDELLIPEGSATAGDPIVDEFQLHDHLSFLDDPATGDHSLRVDQKSTVSGDLFCPDVSCRSTSGDVDGVPFPYRVGWGVNGNHHRRSWSAADLPLRSDAAAGGFAWKPCLYYSRGYCKEGSACRFLHGLPEETAMAATQSQRISAASQLMASAFPYSPLGSLPSSPSSTATKSLDFLLQQHQNESQRAEAAAAAALLRIKMERSDLAAMVNPGSRQIYLTFPSDSTFTEEDVSNYFSIYGPVQDVRIPYQQKRMFGFVTFIFPETVKLILAKGNPHFVCNARVLVKPYKEKGKVLDKCRKQQQSERGYFSGCATPTSVESRGDPYDLQQLVVGARMLYNSGSQELLRRKLEEQQQSLELQRVIELQARRLMNLQLLDLKKRSLSSSAPASITSPNGSAPLFITIPTADSTGNGSYSSSQEHSPIGGAEQMLNASSFSLNAANSAGQTGSIANPNQDSSFNESMENNLPDSPFASPTKLSIVDAVGPFTVVADADANDSMRNSNHKDQLLAMPPTSIGDMAGNKSCFIPMPSPGAIGM